MKRHLSSFFSFLKTHPFPTKEDFTILRRAPASALKIVFLCVAVLATTLTLSVLLQISARVSTEIPDYGGSVTEGVIGAPRFINPLLATTETDQLLVTLVYAGLLQPSDEGNLLPLLASTCTESPDAKAYQCTLKNNLVFSNNKPLTSDDVFFTFQTKKLLALSKDPQSDWADISTQVIDEKTILIQTAGSPDALREKLTLGIVSKSLWEQVPLESIEQSDQNIRPVGAGAFAVARIVRNNTIPTEAILKRNPHFAGEKPFLKKFIIHAYANQLDLKASLHSKEIQSTSALRGSYIDEQIQNDFTLTEIPTNKTVSLFVAQSARDSMAAQKISALSDFIDKNGIIDTIEHGYGIPLYTEGITRSDPANAPQGSASLSIQIAVQKDEDLINSAQLLSEMLREFGILSTVNVFDQGLYTDQIRLGSYSFVLATSTGTIPGYQRLIPLYTKTLIHITAPGVHTPTQSLIESAHESARDAGLWYTRVDRVWNWFN